MIQVIVGTDEQLKIKLDGDQDPSPVPLKALAARVRDAQKGDAATPVVISADRNVKYEAVVKTMDVLQRAGIQRVGLAVKNGAPADR